MLEKWLQASGYGRDEVKRCADIFRGQIVDVTPTLFRSASGNKRKTGCSNQCVVLLKLLKLYAQIVGVSRGDKIMR